MNKYITVLTTQWRIGNDNSVRVVCDMSDGSIWSCNKAGDDWKEEKPSYDTLTIKFNGRPRNVI